MNPPEKRPVAAAPRPLAPHAGRRLFFTYAVIGAFATLVGGFAIVVLPGFSVTVIGLLEITVGLWCFGQGVYGLAAGRAVQAVNTSLNLIGQGRLREAEALLDAVRSTRVRNVERAILVQRAMIAMRRGAITDAIAACDAAIRVPFGLGNRLHAALQRTNAHAIRAFLRASQGDAEGARADIAEVRKEPTEPPQAAARASLAEALLLEKAEDRAALAALLRRDRRLLLDATEPRERTIVRGLARLVRAPTNSVYRKPAEPQKQAPSADEPALADWVQALAPELSAFVRAEIPSVRPGDEARAFAMLPTDEARKAIAAARAQAAKQAQRGVRGKRLAALLAVFAVLAAAGVATNNVLTWTPLPSGGSVDPAPDLGLFGAILSGLLVLATSRIALRIRRARKETRELTRVATQLLRGDLDGAERALWPLTKSPALLTAAQADLFLASIADRRSDYPAALARCDSALGRLSNYAARVISGDLLYPEIIAARAATLAALGRSAEAAAEISNLPAHYPFLARARFRTELIAFARQGDFESAAKLAATAPLDLPIGPRDELLRDVVRAAVTPEAAGSAEIERLRDDLREAPDHRAWLAQVAPGLLERFEKATTADADGRSADAASPGGGRAREAASPGGDRARDTDPGREAEAEAEALAEAEAVSGRLAVSGPRAST